IGAWLSVWLVASFQPPICWLIYAASLFVGLTLTADRFVFVCLKSVGRGVIRLAAVFGRLVTVWRSWRLHRKVVARSATSRIVANVTCEEADDIPIHRSVGLGRNKGHAAHQVAKNAEARELPPIIRPGPLAAEEDRFADFELPPIQMLDDPKPF